MIKSLEIKPLCSLILQKTIDDADKYQSGLTKIFFRAGMLAALESLRSDRLNALVTLIQKNWRRRMAVKKYNEMRRAAIKIQTWWRGVLARRFVESVRREVYAIRLQTILRRFLQRRKFLSIRQGIVLLAKPYASAFLPAYYSDTHVNPQAYGEQKARRQFLDARTFHAATTLQQLLRGW